MGEVAYYLKKAEKKSGKSLIYLQFKYNGLKLVYSFGQNIDPNKWNAAKQRVRSSKESTADGLYSLNDLLDNLETVLLAAYRKEISKGIPTRETLKKHLNDFFRQHHDQENGPSLYNLIDRFISGEIKYRGATKSLNTTKTYNTVKGHLQEFERKHRYPITFDSINLDFFYKYIQYLSKEGLAQNTKAKHIQVIKVFMNEALDLGYTSNMQHKHRKFTVSWEDSEAVYLTDSELMRLYRHDFSNNKKLDQVRDLFLFGAYVGLRFSDYSDIKPENILKHEEDTFIKMRTKKTGEMVVIPANPVVLDIFKKYSHNKNSLPKSLSNQKFNDYIKDACKEAELKETGRLQREPDLELWQCVSSHTARRSFATNLYLDGYPTIEIMKMTGHKTEKSFLKYIKVSQLEAAKKLSQHIKKNWGAKLARVDEAKLKAV